MKDIKSSKHSRIILAVKNFMAQGMLYMEAEEVVFRLRSHLYLQLATRPPRSIFSCVCSLLIFELPVEWSIFCLLRYLVVGEYLDKEKINLAVAFLSVLHEKGRFEEGSVRQWMSRRCQSPVIWI